MILKVFFAQHCAEVYEPKKQIMDFYCRICAFPISLDQKHSKSYIWRLAHSIHWFVVVLSIQISYDCCILLPFWGCIRHTQISHCRLYMWFPLHHHCCWFYRSYPHLKPVHVFFPGKPWSVTSPFNQRIGSRELYRKPPTVHGNIQIIGKPNS